MKTPEERADAILGRLVKTSGGTDMKQVLVKAFNAVERETVEDIVGLDGVTGRDKFGDLAEDAFRFTHWLLRCCRGTPSYPRLIQFETVFKAKTEQYRKILKESAPERLDAFAKEL